MIDLISEMRKTGIIDQKGKLKIDESHPRMRQNKGEAASIVTLAESSAAELDIIFTDRK